uniref:Uncharacterized protein orf65 n=1 Tax=Monomastix sp. (strain OKE-1) TaxID=141716 RepID=C0JWL5_MONSK|nr:hypothetical protein MoOKC_p031 [Monomastix sp. OKE-1]ACK36933.1 unknown [Monomastix sp. OKE-1]
MVLLSLGFHNLKKETITREELCCLESFLGPKASRTKGPEVSRTKGPEVSRTKGLPPSGEGGELYL